MTNSLTITVNGQKKTVTTDPDRSLLEVLREDLGLTGAHFGCGAGDCGACSALVDGKRVFSCSTPVGQVDGKTVLTIEGLADGDKLHPIQQAFLDETAFQCAYCTPGMIMTAVELLNDKPHATEDEIRTAMNSNLCRCGAYVRILKAIRRVATGNGGAR